MIPETTHKDFEWVFRHNRGWRFSNYFFTTDSKTYPKIEIRACDEEHAWKQARKWARKDGFTIIELIG